MVSACSSGFLCGHPVRTEKRQALVFPKFPGKRLATRNCYVVIFQHGLTCVMLLCVFSGKLKFQTHVKTVLIAWIYRGNFHSTFREKAKTDEFLCILLLGCLIFLNTDGGVLRLSEIHAGVYFS